MIVAVVAVAVIIWKPWKQEAPTQQLDVTASGTNRTVKAMGGDEIGGDRSGRDLAKNPIVVSEPYSIATANQTGGTNSITINQGPQPIIAAHQMVFMNVPAEGVFKTEAVVVIGHPSDSTELQLKLPPAAGLLRYNVISNHLYTLFIVSPYSGPAKQFYIDFFTANRVQESDFQFSLTNRP